MALQGVRAGRDRITEPGQAWQRPRHAEIGVKRRPADANGTTPAGGAFPRPAFVLSMGDGHFASALVSSTSLSVNGTLTSTIGRPVNTSLAGSAGMPLPAL